ncbi:MAG: 4Fe-4S binding protein, partial [Phycisphaerales bacterium]|nr:4Fe-4S binding protein [Phycisphaerales bacterium]
MGPRRATVLILIHVAIAAHIIHWRVAGTTLSPVEPSEAMQTLNNGFVNAGFIFFVLAILSTLIVGRFFCGWGCHIVALQDLCAWMLKKVGIRPAPFKSRLLMYAPLSLALYMFVWPSLKRVIAPTIASWSPTLGAWLGPIARFPDGELSNHLLTNDFWATFASIPVAIPFLLVCGFATVYFLGAKGFCTYGCPYGGFFAPADLAAPGRIIVDHDKCEGCGHCTAVCTSNVRVHEEIREYGMVVDPGCMKCMDCVSVCPNNALSFGFRKPALLKGAPRNKPPHTRLDTTLGQDFILAAVFIAVFLGSRGQYGVIPMLMSMGLASIAAFLAWKCMMLVARRDVRVARLQIKRSGRITTAGAGFIAIVTLLAALTAHSLFLSQYKWRAGALFNELMPDASALTASLGANTTPESASKALQSAALYERTLSFRSGGIGLFDNQTA